MHVSQSMLGNIDMGLKRVIYVGTPIDTDDTSTKGYCDSQTSKKLDALGGKMSGDIDMSSKKIINLGNPVGNGDGATKGYVDTNYLS